ncbi:putative O-glycosylation ligase, exosortase A system-associated [Ectothiorhodospira shaposhnikovii]|uniref:putative O-glycosylation ligase, exosortase A system-associated n=1 Tax=Ectothiorhodospira shaposhnikovii TaxID=1054 RepID=UPI001908413E|nr:putative O-glycosylation ligase, exosortase A system-associated [Ectothiorhodospira shaposhnikovii]MBK1672750.1 putative O-glycosylation ligase, exosortase A system-associated [Ectothiorhodospira shaposhnikovii]
MRDLALLAILAGLIPIILMRPWTGIVAWFWVGLMAPHALTWGFMRSFPIATVIGLTTLVALFLARDRRPMPMTREMIMMFVLAGYFAMTSALGVVPHEAWDFWLHFMKILLITFVTPMLIHGPQRILAVLLVITFSIGFYGIKGGLFAVMTGGAHMVLGPPRSFLSGNNYIGLAMIMVLPLILATARMFHQGWVQWPWPSLNRFARPIGWGAYGAFWLTVIAILATYSRGALVGLLAVAPFIFLRMRHKWFLVAMAFILISVVGITAPDRLVERWQTIQTYEEDQSAMQRIQAWGVNWNMAMERPLTGMGFRNTWMDYDWWVSYANFEGTWGHVLSPHSIYFGLMGAHGFGGVAVFLLLVGFTFMTLNRIRRRAVQDAGNLWLAEYAWAIQVGLVGYLVAGAFLDVAYFNLLYAFVALAIIMRRELDESLGATGGVARVIADPSSGSRIRFPDFVAAPVRDDGHAHRR